MGSFLTHDFVSISDAVTCYECTGKAVNSTCGDPFIIEDGVVPNITKCKKGACIKWTYYKNGKYELYMVK